MFGVKKVGPTINQSTQVIFLPFFAQIYIKYINFKKTFEIHWIYPFNALFLLECKGKIKREVVIITESSDLLPYNRANMLFQTATRLGGTLYSKYRTVKTLQVRLSRDQKDNNKYYFESSTIKSKSEHPSQVFERIDNEATDTFLGLKDTDHASIIWLTDVADYTESEEYTFNLFGLSNTSGQPLKYRIVVVGHTAYNVNIVNDVTQLTIRDINILGTLGATLFPSICKGL
jgi:hypothetical protein